LWDYAAGRTIDNKRGINWPNPRYRRNMLQEHLLQKNTEGESEVIRRKIEITMSINTQGVDFSAYATQYSHNLHPDNNLTFLLSPLPFELPQAIEEHLELYSQGIVAFYQACDEMLRVLPKFSKWGKILTHNRPEWLLQRAKEEDNIAHIFLRPDFILTEDGVATAEIETSPFGLALALFLNNAYAAQGLETIPNAKFIDYFIAEVMGDNIIGTLCFMITAHTQQYRGQFQYLTQLLKNKGINVCIAMSDDINVKDGKCFVHGERLDVIYRGFYLYESINDEHIASILQSDLKILPGYKSHLEEKAIMAMFFDDELEAIYRAKIGYYYDVLYDIFPKTYILSDKPPNDLGLRRWDDLADMPRKKRCFVLKISGFSYLGAWSRGVIFLNTLSQQQCRKVIQTALASDDVFVIQEFKKGCRLQQEYYDFQDSTIKTMHGRVRFTPYLSAKTGQLLTAKTTMCEHTDYIHASTNSINSPIKYILSNFALKCHRQTLNVGG